MNKNSAKTTAKNILARYKVVAVVGCAKVTRMTQGKEEEGRDVIS